MKQTSKQTNQLTDKINTNGQNKTKERRQVSFLLFSFLSSFNGQKNIYRRHFKKENIRKDQRQEFGTRGRERERKRRSLIDGSIVNNEWMIEMKQKHTDKLNRDAGPCPVASGRSGRN